jgi:branched-chain amino acid transport system ATP-binding protein
MNSPKILVLDEPSLGLAPLIIQDYLNTLVEIKNKELPSSSSSKTLWLR